MAQFRCPKCGASLVQMHYKGIEIAKCSYCRGIWLDGGELERMLMEEQGFLQALKRILRKAARHSVCLEWTTPILWLE